MHDDLLTQEHLSGASMHMLYSNCAEQDGLAHVFMARLNKVAAVRDNMLALMTGLREVTLVTCGRRAARLQCQVEFEPTLVALGPSHLAVVAHNKACSPCGLFAV